MFGLGLEAHRLGLTARGLGLATKSLALQLVALLTSLPHDNRKELIIHALNVHAMFMKENE